MRYPTTSWRAFGLIYFELVANLGMQATIRSPRQRGRATPERVIKPTFSSFASKVAMQHYFVG